MKKYIIPIALFTSISLGVNAQTNKVKKAAVTNAPKVEVTTANEVAMPTTSALNAVVQTPELMHFDQPVHDFGHLKEGPAAEHEFTFINKGKEPIIISNVSASCGCTTPSYSKDPVLPGKKGSVKVAYSTQGRVGPFTKTITINSNVGTKVITIKGEVDKAPTGSVPENNSIMRNN
jgi:hypothetical protein